MSRSSNRATRSVQIADHLWDLFEEMAKAVGSDRDGLINQAMFAFARLNGFLEGQAADTSSEDESGYVITGSTAERPIEPIPSSSDDTATAPKFIGLEAAAAEPDAPAPTPAAVPPLILASSDGRREKISKNRFVIGRGRHCDFVIDSGKVSREHAAIVREGADYFIEDLKSSNGTWFNKQRIARRQIRDGDQYLICNDKITFVFE
jgi:FHA domain-containing protein